MQTQRTTQEKITLIISLMLTIGALPFSVYRYQNGDYSTAFVESLIAVSILMMFFYIWRTSKLQIVNYILGTVFVGASIAAVHLKGCALVYWAYPTTLAIFFILPQRYALLMNLITIIAIIPALQPHTSMEECNTIIATLVLLSLLGYIFTTVNQKQSESLSRLATRDGLTGVLNRRSLDERLSLAAKTQNKRRQPQKNSMIMLDLDHFKQINDTYGHSAGDDILIRVAELISDSIRSTDKLYRYGGEEFVVYAEGADLANAARLAEKIRKLVEESDIFEQRTITVSLGVAELDDNVSPETSLQLADAALYKAKKQGRNQYCLAA